MLLLLFVATVGPALVFGLMSSLLDPRRRRHVVEHAFWCPIRDRSVDAEIEVDECTLRPTDIRACSAFDPPDRVLCHKRCRDLPVAAPALRR